jgi:hypothetical protein
MAKETLFQRVNRARIHGNKWRKLGDPPMSFLDKVMSFALFTTFCFVAIFILFRGLLN